MNSSTLEHLNDVGIIANLVKEVRLVGDELDNVKANKDKVNYLVEWNLPEDLTMEKYLERKKQNSVYYDEVPEVSFARTYVCEDMTKCLCFYDAPDERLLHVHVKQLKPRSMKLRKFWIKNKGQEWQRW